MQSFSDGIGAAMKKINSYNTEKFDTIFEEINNEIIFVESLNTCLENLKIITGLEEKDIPKPDFHDVFDGSKIEYQKINYGYQIEIRKMY